MYTVRVWGGREEQYTKEQTSFCMRLAASLSSTTPCKCWFSLFSKPVGETEYDTNLQNDCKRLFVVGAYSL